jgi:hypothetical protein
MMAATREPVKEPGMDSEHRVITELLALKDAPDDMLVNQVDAIGERAARHMLCDMLCDDAARLPHIDLPAATDCAALADRIDALIRPASSVSSCWCLGIDRRRLKW